VGLPKEIIGTYVQKNIFGFSDALLGSHIRTAYHALALDEKRKDFVGRALWNIFNPLLIAGFFESFLFCGNKHRKVRQGANNWYNAGSAGHIQMCVFLFFKIF
jgi:hypothetical protein